MDDNCQRCGESVDHTAADGTFYSPFVATINVEHRFRRQYVLCIECADALKKATVAFLLEATWKLEAKHGGQVR